MKFYLYWIHGKKEEVEGETIHQALTSAGYGAGAIRALDFYGLTDNYVWNPNTQKWDKKES